MEKMVDGQVCTHNANEISSKCFDGAIEMFF
jgi:hypothetical protein